MVLSSQEMRLKEFTQSHKAGIGETTWMQTCSAAKPLIISLHSCRSAVHREPSSEKAFWHPPFLGSWNSSLTFSHPLYPPLFSLLYFKGIIPSTPVPLLVWMATPLSFSLHNPFFFQACILLPRSWICWPPTVLVPFSDLSLCLPHTPTTFWTVKCVEALLMQNTFKKKAERPKLTP